MHGRPPHLPGSTVIRDGEGGIAMPPAYAVVRRPVHPRGVPSASPQTSRGSAGAGRMQVDGPASKSTAPSGHGAERHPRPASGGGGVSGPSGTAAVIVRYRRATSMARRQRCSMIASCFLFLVGEAKGSFRGQRSANAGEAIPCPAFARAPAPKSDEMGYPCTNRVLAPPDYATNKAKRAIRSAHF